MLSRREAQQQFKDFVGLYDIYSKPVLQWGPRSIPSPLISEKRGIGNSLQPTCKLRQVSDT